MKDITSKGLIIIKSPDLVHQVFWNPKSPSFTYNANNNNYSVQNDELLHKWEKSQEAE